MSNKLSLALLSLIAAVPAAALAAVMVMAFLTRANEMGMMFLVLAGLTLLVAAAVALMPVGIFVFGPKSAGAAAPKKDKGAKAAKAAAEEEALADDEELLEDELGDEELSGEAVADEDLEFDETADTEQVSGIGDLSEEDFETPPEAVSDAEFEMFFDEEEEKNT